MPREPSKPTNMQTHARTFLSILALAAIGACGGGDRNPPEDARSAIPSDWIRIEASCGYALHAPPDVREDPQQGTDSCVDHYLTEGCEYSGDFGPFGSHFDEFEDEPGFERTRVQVDGHAATLVLTGSDERPGPYLAGIYFEPDADGVYLSFFASCMDAEGLAEAEHVLLSIEQPE